MYHPEYGYFNMHFLFLVIWLPSLSSVEEINLRYFISKNEIMMLKCEIPDDFCCSDINKIEFFKNGRGVCTFKDCRPFFDVPLHKEDTRFYRCGCSVGNIRKTHLITTELRKTDYGNWSCACSCGDVTCTGDTISILPPDSQKENDREIKLRNFISKNEIMMLKCEIPDYFCCSNINKIEFFKNGEGVCTFKDCQPFFDVPLYREDTRFYRCGCSVNNIRKTHLITTELRKTDYGNWSCACSCGDVTCRSNTISILPPDYHEENGEGINLRNFISKNEIMMLKCEIPDDFCCSDINKIEVFKNGEGVCTFKDCRSFLDLPLQREDTLFYRCGCSDGNIRKTHLITTELRNTDYGNWSCACSCGDVTCRSNTISNLPPDSHEENDIAPVSNTETESENSVGWFVGIVIVLVIIIGMFLGILFVARCYISRRVKTVRGNCLTGLLLGRAQDEQCKESKNNASSDYAETMSLVSEELEESKTFIPRANRRNQQESKRHIKDTTSTVSDDPPSDYYTADDMSSKSEHLKNYTQETFRGKQEEHNILIRSVSSYYIDDMSLVSEELEESKTFIPRANRRNQQESKQHIKHTTSTESDDPSLDYYTDCISSINEDLQEISSSMQYATNRNQEEFIRYKTNSSDKPVWCICSECEEREQDRERLCCDRVECITRHQDFEIYCFKDIDVTPSNDSEKQREKRTQAFKNYNNWNHGNIATEPGFVILPACCVGMIRKKFPDPNSEYRGIGKQHFFPANNIF